MEDAYLKNELILLSNFKNSTYSYSRKKNEFIFDFNYENKLIDNNNILIIKLKSKTINNNSLGNSDIKNHFTIFSEEISDPILYQQKAVDLISIKLTELFVNCFYTQHEYKSLFNNSRCIRFIISHEESIKIIDFIKQQKSIIFERHQHTKIRIQKSKILKVTEEEKNLENILNSFNKLDINDDRKKEYENYKTIFSIRSPIETINDIINSSNIDAEDRKVIFNNLKEAVNNIGLSLEIDLNKPISGDKTPTKNTSEEYHKDNQNSDNIVKTEPNMEIF
ncbi:17125_t:CDS:1 [Cetraspora pellucida]|uniref:17125_t:CDS:1 n=1 Tax=Cetraspora pellucida TaxID=1433469 RepID=A0A9N9PEJ0_9GLOM|nr:17125_t:CDS:1 [Cetraspora pellucida]